MKINNLKLETSTMDVLVPLKTELVVEQPYSSNTINLKQKKEEINKKKEDIPYFNELLKKEMDKYK